MALNVTPDILGEYSRIPDSSKFPSAVVFKETAITADGKIVLRTIDKSCKPIEVNDLWSLALDGKGAYASGRGTGCSPSRLPVSLRWEDKR